MFLYWNNFYIEGLLSRHARHMIVKEEKEKKMKLKKKKKMKLKNKYNKIIKKKRKE